VDRSLADVFQPVIDAANKAKIVIEKASVANTNAQVRAARGAATAGAREADRAAAAVERAKAKETKAAERAAKAAESAAAKASKKEQAEADRTAMYWAKARDKSAAYAAKMEAKTTREYEREMEKRQRAHESFTKKNAEDDARAQAKEMAVYHNGLRAAGGGAASAAGKGLRAAGGMAFGIAGDLARGAGVNTDFGQMASRNFDLLNEAQNIANSGYMAGDARNGMRVSANDLAGDAFKVGKTTGADANDVMAGLGDFVGKTGDLATGRDIMMDMARLSRATGTNLSDMMAAAGGVAMAMGDTENKGDKLNTIMNSFAAQGKLGAVEIKNLSSQMDKLSAQAGQFEGNLADNMVLLGGLAQEARQRGGATNATQAATSVASFTSMLKTPKRAEEFEKATGKKVFNSSGMLRNPQELIMEALRAKGMDPTGFKTIFANAQGGRAVEGFATLYRQAGGGAAGEKAVTEEFERLKKASIDAAEAQESFALAMKQPKTQAEVFNQTLRETTMKLQNELTPALVALAPAVVEAAKAVAGLVSWITGSSPASKQVSDAQSSVGSVIAANQAGLKSGNVSPGQAQLNYKAEGDALRALEAAKADVAEKKKAEKLSTAGAVAAGIYDNSAAGMLFRAGDAIFGSGKGNGIGGTISDSRKGDTAKAEATQGSAEELMKRMHEESVKLNAFLANNPIQVKVVGGGSLGPPGTPEAGRTPGPGVEQ
jgi:hypothetical protein